MSRPRQSMAASDVQERTLAHATDELLANAEEWL